MDESNIPPAGDPVTKAASASERAGHTLKSATTKGTKLKKAWEWGEHIHFGYVVCSTFLPPVFLEIRNIYQEVTHTAASFAQAFADATQSFWSLLVLTAPMTFAVALILVSFRRNWFSDTPVVRLPFAGIVLVGSAYLSGWSGIGRAFDWSEVVARSEWVSSNATWSMLVEWFRLPLFAIEQYWQVYGWEAFLLSLVAGCFLGSVVKERTAAAQ